MQPYVILNVDGFEIMLIGIITDAVMKSLNMDNHIGTFVGIENTAAEVGASLERV